MDCLTPPNMVKAVLHSLAADNMRVCRAYENLKNETKKTVKKKKTKKGQAEKTKKTMKKKKAKKGQAEKTKKRSSGSRGSWQKAEKAKKA